MLMNKDTDFVSKKETFSYYSNLLKKPFDSINELKNAEKDYLKKHEEDELKQNEKREKAKAIEDAYKHSLEIRKDCDLKIKEADSAYLKLRDEFVKDYGCFHMTYRDSDSQTTISYLAGLFTELFK